MLCVFREGINCKTFVENAAYNEDIDMLFAFKPTTSPAIKRSYGRSNLAQQCGKASEVFVAGGHRGEQKHAGANRWWITTKARMLIATGYMALRRLDAAREALHGLQQPEGYDEPEIRRSSANGSIQERNQDDDDPTGTNSDDDYLQNLGMMKT